MKTYKVYSIKWDVDDGDYAELPREVIVTVTDDEDPEDFITDYLSDKYGYCHQGYSMEKIN